MTLSYTKEDGTPWTKAEFEAMYGPVRVDTVGGYQYHVHTMHARYDRLASAEAAAILAVVGEQLAEARAAARARREGAKVPTPAPQYPTPFEVGHVLTAEEMASPDSDAAEVVTVLDENGRPMPGVSVVFYWPDAPADPTLGWFGKGVVGVTKEDGTVGFGMGAGAYYTPPKLGPHAVWIRGQGVSECVYGIGMISYTNHYHPDVVFQRGASEPPPEPPPPVESEIVAALLEIAVVLEEIRDKIPLFGYA